jgi:hypothetical protein
MENHTDMAEMKGALLQFYDAPNAPKINKPNRMLLTEKPVCSLVNLC